MRLAVCDESRLFSDALVAVLERRGHDVVLSSSSAEDVVTGVRDLEVDLVVLDVRFPRVATVEAIEAIGQISPTTDVVVLAEGNDPSVTEQVLLAGARVCVDKRARLDDVVDAIERQAVNGHVAMSVVPVAADWSQRSLGRFLTPREREVLEGLAAGDSTSRLAARLGVGAATARTHVQNVLSKLGVHSRLEAVLFAVEHDLISMPDLADQRSA